MVPLLGRDFEGADQSTSKRLAPRGSEIDNSSVGTYGGGGPKFVQNELGKKYIAIAG
jgi:hypothetical protein